MPLPVAALPWLIFLLAVVDLSLSVAVAVLLCLRTTLSLVMVSLATLPSECTTPLADALLALSGNS